MNNVLQSGQVTPGHISAWVTDGVIGDAGVTFVNTLAFVRADVLGINFNATNQDNPVAINLPVGSTRYRIQQIMISGASGTLTTATCGVWTQAGAAGVNIVTTGTAITVSTNLADTNNNLQLLTVINQNSQFFNDTTIYFRVQNPQGNAATANLTFVYELLP